MTTQDKIDDIKKAVEKIDYLKRKIEDARHAAEAMKSHNNYIKICFDDGSQLPLRTSDDLSSTVRNWLVKEKMALETQLNSLVDSITYTPAAFEFSDLAREAINRVATRGLSSESPPIANNTQK